MQWLMRLVLVGFLIFLVGPVTAAQTSDCIFLLTHPVFREETLRTSTVAASGLRELQCASEWSNRQDARKAGVDATVPIYGLPSTFGGDYESSSVESWKSQNCSATERNGDYRTTLERTIREVDPVAARAFVECAIIYSNQPRVLGCRVSESTNTLTFELEWRRTPGELATAAPRLENLFIEGATCTQRFARNYRVKEGGDALLCRYAENETPVFVVNTDRGACTAEGSGLSASETLSGVVSLTAPTTWRARSVRLGDGLKVVTNGWPLTIEAQTLVLQGSPQIVSFEPRESDIGAGGRSAAPISIRARSITGGGLSILNAGEAGGPGRAGTMGSPGSKGETGSQRYWNLSGCHGGSNGGSGAQGGQGHQGGPGGAGGAAGSVQLELPFASGADDFVTVRTDVLLSNERRDCGGKICGGNGGTGGPGGPGGAGGPGGDGASGTWLCGGTDRGPDGPVGTLGATGERGPDGESGRVRRG